MKAQLSKRKGKPPLLVITRKLSKEEEFDKVRNDVAKLKNQKV